MAVCGLTCNPSIFSVGRPTRRSAGDKNSVFPDNGNTKVFFRTLEHPNKNMGLCRLNISYKTGPAWKYMSQRTTNKIKSAMDASLGDMADNSTAIFPRINIRDPYKRLGISREASEEEIQGARNFLINKYAAHEPSVDSIESAHSEIIWQKLRERRRPKLNIKKKVKDVTQSRLVQAVVTRFRVPATDFIIKTASVFAILGLLTVLFPTEEGPTLQVAISLVATIYFMYDRLKSKIRALLYGVGAFGISWLLGTFLMVSVIPPILRGPRSLEVTTSLITYVLLWVSSTYVK